MDISKGLVMTTVGAIGTLVSLLWMFVSMKRYGEKKKKGFLNPALVRSIPVATLNIENVVQSVQHEKNQTEAMDQDQTDLLTDSSQGTTAMLSEADVKTSHV